MPPIKEEKSFLCLTLFYILVIILFVIKLTA